jgi:hypothetical protein
MSGKTYWILQALQFFGLVGIWVAADVEFGWRWFVLLAAVVTYGVSMYKEGLWKSR